MYPQYFYSITGNQIPWETQRPVSDRHRGSLRRYYFLLPAKLIALLRADLEAGGFCRHCNECARVPRRDSDSQFLHGPCPVVFHRTLAEAKAGTRTCFVEMAIATSASTSCSRGVLRAGKRVFRIFRIETR